MLVFDKKKNDISTENTENQTKTFLKIDDKQL